MKGFSFALHAELVSNTTDYPFCLVNICLGGNGPETMRVVMIMFELRTLGTKNVISNTTITNTPSKRADGMERNLLEVGRCEVLDGTLFDEDLGTIVTIDLCVKHIKGRRGPTQT